MVSSIPGLREFLRDYPLMAPRPRPGQAPLLVGRFAFVARHPDTGEIDDAFDLEIEVPAAFPKDLPKVTEIGSRIPRDGEHHVNATDDTLCLGSPLSLLLKLSRNPTLNGFAETCLVPYLHAVSYKLRHRGPFPFGELAHGAPGVLADYMILFGLQDVEHVRDAVHLLGIKKRHANKLRCPCRCGLRLGRCKLNSRLKNFRSLASRGWYRAHFAALTR